MQPKKHVRFDWAIKRLLRQKANFAILEGFLSELLKEDIQIVEVLDSESNQETATDKYNRVDILVKDTAGDLIIIEIQNAYAIDYFLRILYGISKAITEHLATGDEWTAVKKVISINIVYFNLGRGEDYIYKGETHYYGLHRKDELELSEAQKRLFKKGKVRDLYPEIYLIKVDNFDNNATDTLDEWIYFLKNSEIKSEFTAKGLQQADEVLRVANMPDEERRDYVRFGEVLSDRASQARSLEIELEMAAEAKQRAVAAEAKAKAAEAHAAKAEAYAAEAEAHAAEAEAHAAEAEAQAAEAKAQAETDVRAAVDRSIKAMIDNTALSDRAIADALNVTPQRVTELRGR